jgi:hypothetical protein
VFCRIFNSGVSCLDDVESIERVFHSGETGAAVGRAYGLVFGVSKKLQAGQELPPIVTIAVA